MLQRTVVQHSRNKGQFTTRLAQTETNQRLGYGVWSSEAKVVARVKRAVVGGQLMTDVLVVEDVPLVRQMITDTLRDAGLNVAEAESADAALKTAKAASRLPDVLVTDVQLGRSQVDGRELAGKLRRRSPSLAVIYLADHSAAVPERALDIRERYLTKPFEPARLAQLVCEMAPPCPKPPRLIRGRPVMR